MHPTTINRYAILLISFLLVCANIASSDPDVVWQVQTLVSNNGRPPYPVATDISESFNALLEDSAGGISGAIIWNGTVSGSGSNSTFVSQVRSQATGTYSGGRLILDGALQTSVKVLGGKTARIITSMTASVDVNSSLGSASAGFQGSLGFPALAYSNGSSVSAGGNEEDSTSGAGEYTNHGNCSGGTTYRTIDIGRNWGYTSSGSGFSGNQNGESTMSYDTIIGPDSPVALIEGPLVGGVPTSNPSVGATVTFNNISYDPDDDQSGTHEPRLYICAAQWRLTNPEGTYVEGTNLASFSSVVSMAGRYTLSMTVTDNEGAQSTKTITFDVGDLNRDCEPGQPTFCEGACSDDQTSVCLNPHCGNAATTSHDPARTRGNPLRNEIRVNSRASRNPAYTGYQWMGNGFFTYGTQVALITSGPGGGTPENPQRVVIDGYGFAYDYGVTGTASLTPGVYPILEATAPGFKLSGAGAPSRMYKTGNYTYYFDLEGKLLSVEDPNGNEQQLTYDSQGRPELVTDISTNRTIEFQYGANGKVDKVIENGGFAYREISYDGANRITLLNTKDSSDDIVRSLSFTYDTSGRVATVTRDSNPATTATFVYTEGERGEYSLVNVQYAETGSNLEYFAPRIPGVTFRTAHTNAKGGTTYYDFDSVGNLLTVRKPTYYGATLPAITSYTYYPDRSVHTASNGQVTRTYTYNALGLLTHEEDGRGEFRTYSYDVADLTGISDNLGLLATIYYNDARPNLSHAASSFTDAGGHTWTIGRNDYGQVTSIVPPAGSPTGEMTFDYEGNLSDPDYGYLRTVTNGEGEITTIDSYTSLGDPTSITTNPSAQVSRTVQMAYDGTQRETTFTHDDGMTYESGYTGGNLTSVTDEAGGETTYSYCPECGKLTGVSGPMSWALSWVLDGDRDTTSFVDALTHSTGYDFGLARELKQINYPDSTTLKYEYDDYGQLRKSINGRNTEFVYTYNDSGRVTNDGLYSYTYDAAGNVLTATGAFGVITHEYHDNRLPESVTYNFSASGLNEIQVVEYTYNPDNTRATMTWYSDSHAVTTWSYQYDGAGRMTSLTGPNGVISYEYDGEGKLLTQTNPNTTTTGYTYNDSRGWVTDIVHSRNSVPFASYDLVYDAGLNKVGNITQVTELSGDTVTFGYDELYRLTSEARVGSKPYNRVYGYDLAGNLLTLEGSSTTTQFGTYDSANKFATVPGGSATYDADGNLTYISGTHLLLDRYVESGSGNIYLVPASQFWWDGKSRLTKQSILNYPIEYGYDHSDRRIWSKEANRPRRFYVFDGDLLIGEVDKVLNESFSVPYVAYTWGADGLAAQKVLAAIGSSSSLFYHFGPQGETRYITDGAGTTVNTYVYNAYGKIMASTGPKTNKYLYGGKVGYYTDGGMGLMLAGHRWYSSWLMRWLSRDPIRYEGGSNLYEYVKGRPTYWNDPEGHQVIEGAIGVGVYFPPAGVAIGGAAVILCATNPTCRGKVAEVCQSVLDLLPDGADGCPGTHAEIWRKFWEKLDRCKWKKTLDEINKCQRDAQAWRIRCEKKLPVLQ